MQQDAAGVAAEFPDIQRMGAQPFDQSGADTGFIALRQPFCSPDRQQLAGVFDDFGHFCQQAGQAAFGAQIQNHASDKPAKRAEHDQGDQRHHQHLGPVVIEAADHKPRRQQMHQLHHQQAGQQRRQQVKRQGQQQSCRHHQPGGDFVT